MRLVDEEAMRGKLPGFPLAGLITVIVDDERGDLEAGCLIDTEDCRMLVADVLTHEDLSERDFEVHVHLVDEEPIAALNLEHMGLEGPTVVLSFPIEDPVDLSLGSPSEVPLLLGDIVLCPTVAYRQAAEHAGDFDSEIALLLVHGVLHLLGYDHAVPDDEAVMRERERLHLARYMGDRHGGPHL